VVAAADAVQLEIPVVGTVGGQPVGCVVDPAAATGPAAAAPAGAGAPTPAVTGLLVRVVRTDGRVLQRIFPVMD
jgi:hypothetical protein